MNDNEGIGVAVVQAAGVPFDLEAAIAKVGALTAEAAARGSQLVLFPEAYVGGYPWGLAFGTSVGGRSSAGRAALRTLRTSSMPRRHHPAPSGRSPERRTGAAARYWLRSASIGLAATTLRAGR